MADKSYGYKTHVVKYGDSIQKIAYDYDISDWREIVYFNNLESPYINAESYDRVEGNVANIGDTIYIPSYDYEVSPKATSSSISDNDMIEQAYGCDLDIYTAVDDNGRAKDLMVVGQLTDSDNDLMLARGIQNLKQQLTIKLSTRKNTLMLHPEWGCNVKDMCGTKGTQEHMIDMMLMVKEAIIEDFRITSIKDLQVEKVNDVINIYCKIIPISPYPEFEYSTTITR